MHNPYILVIDDEPNIRQLVKEILEDEGFEVAVAQDGASAKESLQHRRPDLVLLDIWMPDIDGITLFKQCFAHADACPVIVMSGHATVETAVEATRLGAFSFLEKPLSINKLLPVVEEALNQSRPTGQMASGDGGGPLVEPVGKSLIMQSLREQIKKLSQSSSPVLCSGEAGTGKSVCARYLHGISPRHSHPFVAVELSALPTEGLAALLFGSEYGGAIEQGYLDQAQGGTLYLSDLEDLAVEIQLRLINVITHGSYTRQGGSRAIHGDVRLMFACISDVSRLRQEGRVREDLYVLLKTAEIMIPPLREHREDVPDLIKYFVDTLVEQEQLPYRRFTLPVQNRLRQHDWHGNVSELENLVRQALVLGKGSEVEPEEIERFLQVSMQGQPNALFAEMFALPLREARERFEKLYLEHQLTRAEGSIGMVAKLAGVERTYLYRKLRTLGIDAKQLK